MIHLDYRDARPIYTQIMDGIKEQILSGVLRRGDKLPSVRELASSLTINPNTIQRSYRQLEVEGWIVTVPGKGCFVCEMEENKQQEIDRWCAAFDEAVSSLNALGIPTEQLMKRLQEGGNKHA